MKSAKLIVFGFLSLSQAFALQSCGKRESKPGSPTDQQGPSPLPPALTNPVNPDQNMPVKQTPPVGDPTVTPGTDPGTTPGVTPGTTPGTDPGTTPGVTPGTTPGTDPGTTPGVTPGTTPGTDPGTTPGVTPGTTPGTDPGTTPGVTPGTTPGTDPGTTPGVTPGTTPGTDPGTTPGVTPGTTPGTDPGTTPGVPPIVKPVPVPAPQIARFTVWLDILDNDMVGVPLDEVADRLVASSARASTFNLQSLGRLYADQDPLFENLRKKFKKLEDGIGNYQKWVDLEAEGLDSEVSATVQARLKANRDKARIELDNALISTRFVTVDRRTVPYTKELRSDLAAYNWKPVNADKNEILTKLIDELDDIKAAKYDFTHLEDGNGVHEFRRKMRWFSMETRALNGLITLLPKNAHCPVPSYANVVYNSIAGTKYAVLPGALSEPFPVPLTPCLYVEVAKLVEDVNQIKAKAELTDSLTEGDPTDAVEPEDQAKVQAILDDLTKNDLFGLLQKDLAKGLIVETRGN